MSAPGPAGRSAGGGGGGGQSDERWQGADPVERADEVVLPGPAGGEMQRPLAGGAGQAAGDLKQPAA